jgi:hypothetical protein
MKKITAKKDIYSSHVCVGDRVASFDDGTVYHVDSINGDVLTLSLRVGNVYDWSSSGEARKIADLPLVRLDGWF